MNDDLISRQAAIELIENDKIGGGSPFVSLPRAQVVNRTCDRHVEGIKNLPSAQKTGRWRLYSPLTDTWECDQCGYQVIDECFRTNYCPDCGARMDGDADADKSIPD